MDHIRVFGLSRLDRLDLKKQYPEATITVETAAARDPQHGELATVAVVALTTVGLQALAAWLLKNRETKKIEKTIEIINADGSRRYEKIVIDVSASTSQADVVKALATLTHFDLSQLGES